MGQGLSLPLLAALPVRRTGCEAQLLAKGPAKPSGGADTSLRAIGGRPMTTAVHSFTLPSRQAEYRCGCGAAYVRSRRSRQALGYRAGEKAFTVPLVDGWFSCPADGRRFTWQKE